MMMQLRMTLNCERYRSATICLLSDAHTSIVTAIMSNFSDIYLPKNAHWKINDAEYTRSSTTLSAVWPGLRHGKYAWKVLTGSNIRKWAYFESAATPDFTNFICSAPEVLACGETSVGLHVLGHAFYPLTSVYWTLHFIPSSEQCLVDTNLNILCRLV